MKQFFSRHALLIGMFCVKRTRWGGNFSRGTLVGLDAFTRLFREVFDAVAGMVIAYCGEVAAIDLVARPECLARATVRDN